MRDLRVRTIVVALAGLLWGACGDEEVGPPPAFPDVVFELGAEGAPAVKQALRVVPDLAPTFTASGRAAWSFDTLFGAVRGAAPASVAVFQTDGTRVDLPQAFRPGDGMLWVLRTNRKGEVLVSLVEAGDPFPAHHGRGGSRGRQGASGRSIRDVARIRLVLGQSSPPKPPTAAEVKEQMMLQLTIEIDGTEKKLSAEDLVELDPIEVEGDSGRGARDAWAVRALVRSVAGDGARLTTVRGRGGREAVVSPASWADEQRVPLLRLNRRGQFKFHWTTPDHKSTNDPDLRDVTALVVVTR